MRTVVIKVSVAAIGPALFEALRWTFAAKLWHNPTAGGGCTVAQLRSVARNLSTQSHAISAQQQLAVVALQREWRELRDALLHDQTTSAAAIASHRCELCAECLHLAANGGAEQPRTGERDDMHVGEEEKFVCSTACISAVHAVALFQHPKHEKR